MEEPQDITNMKHMIDYLKSTVDYDITKFILMEKNNHVFCHKVSHQPQMNISFTHLFIKTDVILSELSIEVCIGPTSLLKISLLLLEAMNLVSGVKDGFILRLPVDYMLGYIPMLQTEYHQVSVWVDILNNQPIDEIYLLIDFAPDTLADYIFPYISVRNCTIDTDNLLVKYNESKSNNYVFDNLSAGDTTNIFGYFLTCDVKDLISVELLVDMGKYYTCSGQSLSDYAIGENLLWIPLCDNHEQTINLINSTNTTNTNNTTNTTDSTDTTNMLCTFQISKLQIIAKFKNRQKSIISVSLCSFSFIKFSVGMTHYSRDEVTFNMCTFNQGNYVIIEDNYLIKKNKTVCVIHNIRFSNELVIFGKITSYIIDYIKANNIVKIIMFNKDTSSLTNTNIHKLKLMLYCDRDDSNNWNNLPITLEKLYVKNLSQFKNYVTFTNLPSGIKKIKLTNIKLGDKSKIPFGTEIID
jgi:hypothetical protein